MDEWEDIDENEPDEEEREDEIMEYCSECDEPLYDGDPYYMTDDGRILCENCHITLQEGE